MTADDAALHSPHKLGELERCSVSAMMTTSVNIAMVIRGNRSSTNDSAYSYTFLCSVVCLSVICHICALCLNCSMDLDAIWQVHLWGLITHCVRWSLTPRGRGDWAVKPCSQKHAIANCCCHLANRKEAIPPSAKLLWCVQLL